MQPFYQKSYILKSHQRYPKNTESVYTCDRISKLNVNDGLSFNSPQIIDRFSDFLNMNQYGYYVYDKGECIFRAWIFNLPERSLAKEGYFYNLTKDESFIAWCETSEDHRRKGVFEFWLKHIVSQSENIIKTYVAPENKASIKAFEKCGFKIDEVFHHFTFSKIKFTVKSKTEGRTTFKVMIGSKIR